MTTEEKARAYDKALEKAKKKYNSKYHPSVGPSGVYLNNADLEDIFPELKESEDEKIRKALVWHLKADADFVSNGVTKTECIAYLEKQKEQKPVDNERVEITDFEQSVYDLCPVLGIEEAKATASDLLELAKKTLLKTGKVVLASNYPEGCSFEDGFHLGYNEGFNAKKKEQKPVNNSTREKIISRAISEKQVVLLSESNGNAEIDWDTRSLEDTKKLLELGITFISERLGMKPVGWSEKDSNMLKSILDEYKSMSKEKRDWLKSLSERLNLQPKQEWNEEDEEIIYSLRSFLIQAQQSGGYGSIQIAQIEKCLNWLKSLPRRFSLEPKHEWSEEDEEVMEDLYNFVISGFIQDHIHETRWKPWKTTLERNRQNRLKSLRPSWKPSEEQMNALKNSAYGTYQNGDGPILRGLYEQLLKLGVKW